MARGRAIVASSLGVLAFAGFVFLGAGTLRYWQGVLYVVLAEVGTTLTSSPQPVRTSPNGASPTPTPGPGGTAGSSPRRSS
ncbi:MAG: hypothetical protein ABMB14_01920 [Myxococcota bacterium]